MGIPEDKMPCLNLTYRCKDPNTGSQMTLEGVNESAFDAAVLCSAAQDKLKQARKSARVSDGAAASPGRSSRSSHRRRLEDGGSGEDADPVQGQGQGWGGVGVGGDGQQ